MPSWMKFAGLWSAAALVALTLSWVAVSQVRDRVIQPSAVIPTTMVALEPDTPEPTVVVVESSVDGQPERPATSSTTGVSSATSTTRPPSARPATTTTTRPPGAPTTSSTSVSTTTAASTNLVTSSHSTAGGSVTIKSAPGEVHFVSAIPQAGYTTELRETGPLQVRVRFVSATLISEFEAEWDDGELDIETSEHTP